MADEYDQLGAPQQTVDPYAGLGREYKAEPDLAGHDAAVAANMKAWAPKNASNPVEAFAAGFGMSDTGLTLAGKMPDFNVADHAPFAQKIAQTVGQAVGDAPGMAAGLIAAAPVVAGLTGAGAAGGAVAGTSVGPEGTVAGAAGGGVAGLVAGGAVSGFAMNAVPEAYRQTLIDAYTKGQIVSPADLVARTAAIAWKSVKAGAVGAATMAAGGAVGGKVAGLLGEQASTLAGKVIGGTAQGSAELAAYSTASAAISGKLPEAGDFGSAAVMILGMHAVGAAGEGAIKVGSDATQSIVSRMQQFYVRTGLTPKEQVAVAGSNPAFREDIMAPPGAPFETAADYKRADPEPASAPKPAEGEEPAPSKQNALTIESGEELANRAVDTPETPTVRDRRLLDEWMGSGGGKPPGTEIGSPAENEPESNRIEPNEDTLASRVMDIVGERPTPKKTVFDYMRDAYVRYADALAPAGKIDKQLGLGRNDFGVEDAFRQSQAAPMRASYFIKEGTIDPITFEKTGDDNWVDALKLVQKNGGSMQNFTAYRLAQRQIELMDRGIETGAPSPTARQDAEQLVKLGKGKYEEAARMIQRNKDAQVDYAQESGIFSKDSAAKMKELNNSHFTFDRIIDTGFDAENKGGARGFRVRNPTKKITGGEAQITDPWAADVRNTYAMITMADRNRAIGNIVGAAEKGGLPKEPVSVTMKDGSVKQIGMGIKMISSMRPEDIKDPALDKTLADAGLSHEDAAPLIAERAARSLGPNQFAYFRNGKMEVWEASDPWVAQMIKGADPVSAGIMSKIAFGVAKVSRFGAVASPEFALARAFRDEAQIAAQSPYGYRPFVDWSIGLWHGFKAGDVYEEWWRNGGAGSTLQEMHRDYIADDIHGLFEKTGVLRAVRNVVTNPAKIINWLDQKADTGMRMGHYLRAKQAGLSNPKAASESAKYPVDYRTASLSAGVNWLSRATPFLRAHITATTQFMKDVADHPGKVLMGSALWVTTPSVALWLANYYQDQQHKNDPNYQPYSEIPRWERDGYFILPQLDGVRLRVQKPLGPLGMVAGALPQRFLDYYVAKDPRGFKDWAQDIAAQLIPNIIPTIGMPLLETATNKNLFTGKDLTPASVAKASPDLRYLPYTSELAKKLSGFLYRDLNIGVSPIQIEQFTKDWVGGNGMAAMHMFDTPLNGGVKPPSDLADNPFVHSFMVRSPNMGAQSVQDFYDAYDKFQQRGTDLRLAERRQNIDEIKMAAQYPAAMVKLSQFEKAISMENRYIQQITAEPSLKDFEKRQLIEPMYVMMWQQAKQGTAVMDRVNGK